MSSTKFNSISIAIEQFVIKAWWEAGVQHLKWSPFFSRRTWNDPQLIFGMEWYSATELLVCRSVLIFTFASLTPYLNVTLFLKFNLASVLVSRPRAFPFSLVLSMLERVSSISQDQPLDNNFGNIKDVKVSCKLFSLADSID